MRNAALDKIWEGKTKSGSGTAILSFNLENLNGLTVDEITVEGPLVAICGFNGTGKTTLLACIRSLLGYEYSVNSELVDPRILASKITANLRFQGKNYPLVKEPGEKKCLNIPPALKVHYIDPTHDAVTLQRTLQQQEISSLLIGIEGRDFNSEELATVSRIIGKNYAKIRAFDLSEHFLRYAEDEGTRESSDNQSATQSISKIPLQWIPHFEVEVEDSNYDTKRMGLGELAVLYLYWILDSIERDSVVLLEEPESFITPVSQTALASILLKFAVENRFMIIFTSHSEELVSRLPLGNLILSIPDPNGGAGASSAQNKEEHIHALRLTPRKIGIFICEDWGAIAFLRAILRLHDHVAASRFEFVPAFSESNITRLLTNFPRRHGATPLVGVFDGDVVVNKDAASKYVWPHCFLPGNEPPEKVLLNTLRVNFPELCHKLELNSRNAQIVWAGTAGLDYHDVMSQLSSKLGCSHDEMVSFAIKKLNQEERWQVQFTNFMKSLDESVRAVVTL